MARSAPRRSIREIQKEQTFDLLLHSARELFCKQGYLETTVHQITAEVGASRATFYLHFQGKWDAVRHLVRRILTPETLQFYERLDSLGVPTRNELRSWLDDALRFYEKHSQFMIVYRQALAVEPDLSRIQHEFMTGLVDVMPKYLARWGENQYHRACLRLNLLTIQLTDIAMSMIKGDIRIERETLLDVLLEYWTVGLRRPS